MASGIYRLSHRHGDAAIAQRLLDAASAEPDILLTELETTREGLNPEAAAAKLAAFGPNLVAHERHQTLVKELIRRARKPLNFLLLTLASRIHGADGSGANSRHEQVHHDRDYRTSPAPRDPST